jgi:NADPH:quinone reductase-like Zn-dependent oxidoreductase
MPGKRFPTVYRWLSTRLPGRRTCNFSRAHAAWFREDFRALVELLREGRIHPVVAERLPLTAARHAHELLESAASKGKLVLVP